MTLFEKRLIENTLDLAYNSRQSGLYIGDPILLKLYWTIIEVCNDREDRDEIVQMLIDRRNSEISQ
jgi:hypothetical protein